jgi:hypothetical protein
MRLLTALYDDIRALSIRVKATDVGTVSQHDYGTACEHATEAALEEYCFNRLSIDRSQALETHLTLCDDCSKRLEHRKRFIAVIKAALSRPREGAAQGVAGVFAFQQETGEIAEVSVSELRTKG